MTLMFNEIPSNSFTDDFQTIIAKEDFKPISYSAQMNTSHGKAKVEAEYSKKKIKIQFFKEGEATPKLKKMKISGLYYDNLQIVHQKEKPYRVIKTIFGDQTMELVR